MVVECANELVALPVELIARVMSFLCSRDRVRLAQVRIPRTPQASISRTRHLPLCHARSAATRVVSAVPTQRGRGRNVTEEGKGGEHARQWNAQSPGLSGTKRTTIQLYAGMRNVSRRMGLTSFSGWPM